MKMTKMMMIKRKMGGWLIYGLVRSAILLLPTDFKYSVFLFYIYIAFCLSRCLIYSFIHSGYFYSATSSPPLLRSASDTARILCRSFTLKRHRQLRVKDLSKVPTWRDICGCFILHLLETMLFLVHVAIFGQNSFTVVSLPS